MAEPFIGEVKIVSFNWAIKGWAECDGQLLSIAQNQALFSILGTTYGGNGIQTFALPDLRGRTPVHAGTNPLGLPPVQLGESSGQENHTLTQPEMPQHNHQVMGSNVAADNSDPTGTVLAMTTDAFYNLPGASAFTTLNPLTVLQAGGSQPHNNMQPYLVLNFIIALVGVFPSRN